MGGILMCSFQGRTPTFLFVDRCPLRHTSPILLPRPNCLRFLIFKSFMAFPCSFASKSLRTHFFQCPQSVVRLLRPRVAYVSAFSLLTLF